MLFGKKITIGELPPGERLSETALSETLEISRNTLREVFRVLTQEGLLTYKPNRGVFCFCTGYGKYHGYLSCKTIN